MGTYDRALQWRMMQQRHPHPHTHSSLSSSPFFAGGYSALGSASANERRSGLQNHCTNASDANNSSSASTPSGSSLPTGSYYTGDDRQGPMKRQRLTKLSPGPSSSSAQRANSLASYLPSAEPSTQYSYPHASEGYGTGSSGASSSGQEFNSDWFPQRSSIGGSSGLTVNTAANSYSSSSENNTGLGRSLASPTTMFGMENLMADYESGFYSLWNGSNGANVMGYDGETTPTERQHQVETSQVYMPEEELKMDYPQLPDLNQGDLDYIYGTMDANSGRSSEPHIERPFASTKRDRSSPADENKQQIGSGLMSPTQTSLLSPLPPSGFRSLARNTTIETKRPTARSQVASAYHGESNPTGPGLMSATSGANGAAVSRRPSSSPSTAAGSKRPRSRQCDFPGCENRARSHQKCKKHGGAHQCVYEGCMKNSQSRGLCIAHGGGSRCKIDGCTRASQSKGRCKSHGGGEYCAVEGCRKKAHLKHLCRTHGGGVRCKDGKCMKWAQRKGWCMAHAKEVLGS